MAFEQADREATKPGEIVCHASVTRTALVFIECHVHHPVQRILDAPVAANRLGKTLAAEETARDEIAYVARRGAVAAYRRTNRHADCFHTWPLPAQRSVFGNLHQDIVSFIAAPVTLVVRFVLAMRHMTKLIFLLVAEYLLDGLVQLRLVVFHRKYIVTLLGDNLRRDVLLAPHRVDRDNGAFHVDPVD